MQNIHSSVYCLNLFVGKNIDYLFTNENTKHNLVFSVGQHSEQHRKIFKKNAHQLSILQKTYT